MATPSMPRRQSSEFHNYNSLMSHGRGGVGNMGIDEHGYQETEYDFKIPTLKSPIYTTGRGGQGNMAQNDMDHPEYARAAQDVEEIPYRSHHRRTSSDFHGGRGGAGNIVHSAESQEYEALRHEEEEEERRRLQKNPPIDHSKVDYRGWADRGKDLLLRRVVRKKGKY